VSIETDFAAMVEVAVSRAIAPLAAEVALLRRAQEAPRWRSRREQAESLGISLDTLDRMIKRGEAESRRAGRRVLVRIVGPASNEEIGRLAAEARR
jgi:excisionase family DNA binding protein